MEDEETIKRSIFEKLQGRFAEEVKRDLIGKGISTGNTERYDRVVALWVSLRKAMQFEWASEKRMEALKPWESLDQRVRRAWDALTHPRNEVALEIFSHQLSDGMELATIQAALKTCRQRQEHPECEA